jgi:hypothetical protein
VFSTSAFFAGSRTIGEPGGIAMNHQQIRVSDEEIQSKPQFTAFEEKLRKALSEPLDIIVIYLHPLLGCGVDLLEWLETWQERLLRLEKHLYIVPGNVNQLECLEVSHPDQGLKYIADANELEAILSDVAPTAPDQTMAPVLTSIEAAPQTSEPRAPQPAIPVTRQEEHLPKQTVRMDVGTRVELSGEYVCAGCHIARMWLKGDVAAECANPECPSSDAGWDLTYELF